jgi:putative membrane protein
VSVADLPKVNATLNGLSFALLLCGFYFIRKRKIKIHKTFMLSALAVSALFLASYLYYHSQVGTIHFKQTGWIRPVYFTILTSHSILAAIIVPLVLFTLWRALRADFIKHKQIAHWTLPIWLYVSVTGVVIFWMLYLL